MLFASLTNTVNASLCVRQLSTYPLYSSIPLSIPKGSIFFKDSTISSSLKIVYVKVVISTSTDLPKLQEGGDNLI